MCGISKTGLFTEPDKKNRSHRGIISFLLSFLKKVDNFKLIR